MDRPRYPDPVLIFDNVMLYNMTGIAGVLAAREELHGWVKKLTGPALRSGLVLLAMTFVALPVMPDEPIGPLGGVNPREVWMIAIALAGVSFVGYAAVRYYGASRGGIPAIV